MASRRRNRPNNNGGQNRPQHNKATVFDSNGPDVRIRGTAFQIVEKYMALAKDSAASGDRVMAENYLQHAEHYQRLINSWADEAPVRTYEPDSRDVRRVEGGEDPAPDVVMTRPSREQVEDDLSLPASILGARPQAASEGNVRESAGRVAAG